MKLTHLMQTLLKNLLTTILFAGLLAISCILGPLMLTIFFPGTIGLAAFALRDYLRNRTSK